MTIPIEKNTILLRVENIGDVYSLPNVTTKEVDLYSYIANLWNISNSRNPRMPTFEKIEFAEMSLTTNM